MHGISEEVAVNGTEFFDAQLKLYPHRNKTSVYDKLRQALGLSALTSTQIISVTKDLCPQLVIGHRMWSSISRQPERFVRVTYAKYFDNSHNKQLWLSIGIRKSDLYKTKTNHRDFLKYTGISGNFREVKVIQDHETNDKIVFEQITPRIYQSTRNRELEYLSNLIKGNLYTVVRRDIPYRRHYLQINRNNHIFENKILIPYLLIYYLGSVTRYRPHYMEIIKRSDYGPLIEESIRVQGKQFLYLLASEFLQREISESAVIS